MKPIKKAEVTDGRIGEAVLLPLREGVIAVDEWVPKPEDVIVTYSGKTIIIPFNKIWQRDTIEQFNVFDIAKKEAYYKRLDSISLYINYFLKFYDKDKELITAYMKLKYMIDNVKTQKISRSSIIKYIHKWLMSESMSNKIRNMSQDNYRIDLTPKKKSNYPESMKYNERHAEVLMRISTAIKILIPIVLHYIKVFKNNKTEAKDHLYEYFMPLFKNEILCGGINILGKLMHTITVRVNSFSKREQSIYGKHEAVGSSIETFIEDLLHKNIITDTIFAYEYRGNVVSYNSVVLNCQLKFHSKEDLKMDFNEVRIEKDPEGLSGLDKMEMHTTKIDSFLVLFSRVNIDDTVRRIRSRIKMEISEEEIQFYMDNHDYNNTSKELVSYHYAKYFGGFRDLDLIKRRPYTILLIIMKRMLESEGCMYLNQIISANVKGKANARTIRNAKFLDKVETSSKYKKVKENKYSSLKNEKDCPIIVLLSKLINTNWLLIDYDLPDHTFDPLELNNDVLSEEFLNFVDSI